MISKQFEAHKLAREIKFCGTEYTFYRNTENAFGESTGAATEVLTVKGLYHEKSSQIILTSSEDTQLRSQKEPALMSISSEVESLETGDYTVVNGKRYNVAGITNVFDWGIISDVCLEVVDSGGV